MRKLLIIPLLLLAGCSETRKTYVPDPAVYSRYQTEAQAVVDCMDISVPIVLLGTNKPIARIDSSGNLQVSEGIVAWDRDSLRLVIAHELAHKKFKHIAKTRAASYTVTAAMLVAGFFVPGAGYLNHAVNPAVVGAYSRSQELDADKEASEACLKCFNMSIERQVEVFTFIKNITPDGGGFWDQHPSWDDRIKNISASSP